MKIEMNADRASVFTPYNADFVRRLKGGIGGAKWNPSEKCWTVPASSVDAVREIMMDVYGETDVPEAAAKLKLRVKATDILTEGRGPVTLFGKTVSSARGRDSGAFAGDGVCFVAGNPTSGGSVKNWTSVVPEGSEFILSDVPQSLYDRYLAQKESGFDWGDNHANIEVEVVPCGVDVAALNAERARLMERLAEIDALLKEAV